MTRIISAVQAGLSNRIKGMVSAQRIAPDAMSTGCDFGLEGTEW